MIWNKKILIQNSKTWWIKLLSSFLTNKTYIWILIFNLTNKLTSEITNLSNTSISFRNSLMWYSNFLTSNSKVRINILKLNLKTQILRNFLKKLYSMQNWIFFDIMDIENLPFRSVNEIWEFLKKQLDHSVYKNLEFFEVDHTILSSFTNFYSTYYDTNASIVENKFINLDVLHSFIQLKKSTKTKNLLFFNKLLNNFFWLLTFGESNLLSLKFKFLNKCKYDTNLLSNSDQFLIFFSEIILKFSSIFKWKKIFIFFKENFSYEKIYKMSFILKNILFLKNGYLFNNGYFINFIKLMLLNFSTSKYFGLIKPFEINNSLELLFLNSIYVNWFINFSNDIINLNFIKLILRVYPNIIDFMYIRYYTLLKIIFFLLLKWINYWLFQLNFFIQNAYFSTITKKC